MHGLLILIAVLISYGSIYPFDFAANEGSWQEMQALFTQPDLHMGLGDLIGNLLLFLPYGLVAAWLAHPRTRTNSASLPMLLALGALLAFGLQLIQIWLPSRVPSMGDALINLAGMAAGLLLAQPIMRWQRHGTSTWSQPQQLLPAGLMLCWLAYLWFPLVPTLDVGNIVQAIKPLLRQPHFDALRSFSHLISWLVFFQLARQLLPKQASAPRLALLALGLLAAKPLFVGAQFSVANIVGVGLAVLLLPWSLKPGRLTALLLLVLINLFTTGLLPLAWRPSPASFHWIPFSGLLEGSMSLNLLNLIEKTYLYASFILLATYNGARPMPAAAALALCLALIETLQPFLSNHVAEITDPLLALLLGYVIKQFMTNPTLARQARPAPHSRRPDSVPRSF